MHVIQESVIEKDKKIEQLTARIEQMEREFAESEHNTKLWQDNCEMLLSALEPSSRITSPKISRRDSTSPHIMTPITPARSNMTSATRSQRNTTRTQQKPHTQSQKPREISPIRRVADDSNICEVLFADDEIMTPLKV